MFSGLCGFVMEFVAFGAIVDVMAPFAARFHSEYIFFRVSFNQPSTSMATSATAVFTVAAAVMPENAFRNQGFPPMLGFGWNTIEYARMTREAITGGHFGPKAFYTIRNRPIAFYQFPQRQNSPDFHAFGAVIAFHKS